MRIRSSFLLLAVIGALVTPARTRAVCPVPDPPSCIVPACIRAVGHDGFAGDPVGTFTVNVKCDPVTVLPGVPVTLSFGACADIAICSVQLDPGVVVACGPKDITGVTDAFGDVTFTVIGGGTPVDFSSPSCMTITAGAPPVLIASVAVSAYNLDGFGGVGANDLSIWFLDFGSGLLLPRSDYDCSGSVGANDFSLWLATFASGLSAGNCTGVTCP